MDKISLGFSLHFQEAFIPYSHRNFEPGRIVAAHRGRYGILSEVGDFDAEVGGHLRHEIVSAEDLPAVGDWVAFAPPVAGGPAIVHAVLPRRTLFSRGAAGTRTEAQVIAANVDLALVVCALDRDFNLRRIERYLTAAHSSGVRAVVVLTKADLCEVDLAPGRGSVLASRVASVEAIARSECVCAVSVVSGVGVDALRTLLLPGTTLVLLGSSGTGKSTLANHLLGEHAQEVSSVGANARGRHTTTARELFVLPGGALLIDTPGMREFRLWDAEGDALDETFAEIAELAERCRFRDCGHDTEPGCAIVAALAEGALESARWANFLKLQREKVALARRKDARVAAEEKRAVRARSREYRKRDRARGKT